MAGGWFVLVESNTTGSGRLFCDCARRIGLRPVLLARDPERYPYVSIDEIDSRVVDTAAPDAIRAACASLAGRIAGLTSSSEYYIGIAAEVARSLGLPHPDPAAIASCRDKPTQRAQLHRAGLPCPAFGVAQTADEAVAVAARIGLPVVIKPVAGSGSVGVRLCETPAEVAMAAGHVLMLPPARLGLPQPKTVLIEQFLAGHEYSVEVVTGTIVGITRKWLGPLPYFVETGHDFPAPLTAAEYAAIRRSALAALRALGLGWGAAHIELRLAAAGPVIIEVNPRLAGGMIPRMVQEATGIDMVGQVVAEAAGLAGPPQPSKSRAASIRFLLASTAGRLTEVTGVELASKQPGVVEVGLTCEIGQEVVLRHSFQDRLGYVIAAADETAAAAGAAAAALQRLDARIAASVTAEGART